LGLVVFFISLYCAVLDCLSWCQGILLLAVFQGGQEDCGSACYT